MTFETAIANTRAHLLSLRNERGYWEGELSGSALSTATAVVALSLVDGDAHERLITGGARWLVEHQNADGGWGDTTVSQSNLSTTLLCWSALTLVDKHRACRCPDDIASNSAPGLSCAGSFAQCELWIRERVGSLEPNAICKAVIARYGMDKTFSVPILMTCALGGRLGEHDEAWKRVIPLPFELAALPRTWFGAVGLPVVSYALPALIAIGHARFYHAPPSVLNPLRWLRSMLWSRISPMLKALQPSTGGYLEATPLTSFVTMALAGSGEKNHPCVPDAVRFLSASQRADGSWAIDTNLATWGTTLAAKALCALSWSPGFSRSGAPNRLKPGLQLRAVTRWLLDQQYKAIHPFTNAAPGGWAWTDLPGGVPDADDTSGALIALRHFCESDEDRKQMLPAVEAGIRWLLDLQNRDGGVPTFCRGWGTLPFDRSTPEIAAHALLAWWLWCEEMPGAMQSRIHAATEMALFYLGKSQRHDGSWIPLWFGNEHAKDEENPVYGTAQVVAYLGGCGSLARQSGKLIESGAQYLLKTQKTDGSWGGDADAPSSIEETAVALNAVAEAAKASDPHHSAHDSELWRVPLQKGAAWLVSATKNGTHFPPAPIGLYFARLWYHERLYPVIWTLEAIEAAAPFLKSGV